MYCTIFVKDVPENQLQHFSTTFLAQAKDKRQAVEDNSPVEHDTSCDCQPKNGFRAVASSAKRRSSCIARPPFSRQRKSLASKAGECISEIVEPSKTEGAALAHWFGLVLLCETQQCWKKNAEDCTSARLHKHLRWHKMLHKILLRVIT